MVLDTALGVPDISPVEVLNTNPLGNAGDIAQVTTAPPLDVGVKLVIAESFVSVRALGV